MSNLILNAGDSRSQGRTLHRWFTNTKWFIRGPLVRCKIYPVVLLARTPYSFLSPKIGKKGELLTNYFSAPGPISSDCTSDKKLPCLTVQNLKTIHTKPSWPVGGCKQSSKMRQSGRRLWLHSTPSLQVHLKHIRLQQQRTRFLGTARTNGGKKKASFKREETLPVKGTSAGTGAQQQSSCLVRGRSQVQFLAASPNEARKDLCGTLESYYKLKVQS